MTADGMDTGAEPRFPPLLTGEEAPAGADPFDKAVASALIGCDPGLLVWARRADAMSAALALMAAAASRKSSAGTKRNRPCAMAAYEPAKAKVRSLPSRPDTQIHSGMKSRLLTKLIRISRLPRLPSRSVWVA